MGLPGRKVSLLTLHHQFVGVGLAGQERRPADIPGEHAGGVVQGEAVVTGRREQLVGDGRTRTPGDLPQAHGTGEAQVPVRGPGPVH